LGFTNMYIGIGQNP